MSGGAVLRDRPPVQQCRVGRDAAVDEDPCGLSGWLLDVNVVGTVLGIQCVIPAMV
jgi:hypothetical protein